MPVQDPKHILSSFINFWTYWYDEVKLSEDFAAYDENDSLISKDLFLREICTGNYLPLKYREPDSTFSYQLYPLKKHKNSIVSTIVQFGTMAYNFFQMEGQSMPDFHWYDLNGNLYDSTNCKGKIVVLNFWFIGCTACVQEMPELNKIVANYKNQKDVLFISMAPDSPDKLKTFLQKTPFAYAVIPLKNKYVTDTLGIQMFPTHMIIDRNGLIAKIPEDYKQMEVELREQLKK